MCADIKMKLSERLLELIQSQLTDPDKLENIKRKIIAPSLNLVHDEFKRSGYDETLSTLVHSVMWPVILMISITLALCVVLVNMQIYQIAFK
jgi:hypothetical protein